VSFLVKTGDIAFTIACGKSRGARFEPHAALDFLMVISTALPIIYCVNQFSGKRLLRHRITLNSGRGI
jgi:hypothetical protein